MTTRLSKLIKSFSRNSLSGFIPAQPKEFGQPIPSSIDAQGLITPERMRELAMKTPTVSACINSILDYTSSVPLLVRNVDPSKPADKKKVDRLMDYLRRPNPQDTSKSFLYRIYRDLITLGWAGVEIEPDKNGKPANLWWLDSGKLKLDYDEHGMISGYNMVNANGSPIKGTDGIHAWTPDEVIFFARDPISSSMYPTSRLTQLFTCAILEDLMIHFISQRFTDSNIPFGIYDLGEITESELEYAINKWNSQAQSNHRIMLTGSKSGGRWTPFAYHLKDLEATTLLNEIQEKIMAVLGVTKNEFGAAEDVNKANGYNLSFTFKKRAIEPLLNEACQSLTKRLLWDRLNYKDMELYFDEIDSRDDLLQAQIDTANVKAGVVSINQVRNRRGDPSIPGGDVCYVSAGSSWLPVEFLVPFAQAQLNALNVVDDAMTGRNVVQPPITKPPALPISTPTPGGSSGGGTARIKYPNAEQTEIRGPAQAARTQGLRKEDL